MLVYVFFGYILICVHRCRFAVLYIDNNAWSFAFVAVSLEIMCFQFAG
jgi:hypothetical protein